MNQATMSIDERRVRMSELVERMAAVGLGVNFTPHYVELIVGHMFEGDVEGYERFQEDWLDQCEELLTEETVQQAEAQAAEVEAQARRATLMKGGNVLKGQLSLVDG